MYSQFERHVRRFGQRQNNDWSEVQFGVERMGCYTEKAFERLVACEPVGSGGAAGSFLFT